MAVANGYAYVADNTSIQVIRVTTPSSPVIVGSLGMSSATAVAVSGTRLYVLDGSLLKIVDVSNPAAPALLSATTNYSAQAVAVAGTAAFLAKPALNHGDLTGGVYVIDVSNPAQPTFVDQITVAGTTRTVVAVSGFVYVGDSAAIVNVIEIR